MARPTTAKVEPQKAQPNRGDFTVRGVMPVRQARSEATFHALVQAGRKALESGGVDSLKVADLARAAGTSVGAFYGRFESREAFFEVVLGVAMADLSQRLAAVFDAVANDTAVEDFVYRLAQAEVFFYRDNRGLFRAAVRYALDHPASWSKVRDNRKDNLLPLTAILTQRIPGCSELRVRTTVQFVVGMLMNAVLHDPGPLHLDDPAMVEHVTQLMCAYLGIARSRPALAP